LYVILQPCSFTLYRELPAYSVLYPTINHALTGNGTQGN
jgi:hypothetical protein